MKRYTLSYKKNGKNRTVTVEADNAQEAFDELPEDATDIDIEGVEKVGNSDEGNHEDEDKDNGGKGGVEVLSVEEVEDEGGSDDDDKDGGKGDKDDEDKESGKTDEDEDEDKDEVEPEHPHPWYRDRSWRKKS